MDTAVALVQSYLNVNGYFTVAEYPVLEAAVRGPARTLTDLDILAFRFWHAEHHVVGAGVGTPLGDGLPDPALEVPGHGPDMIVGEVKEGTARLNDALHDPHVLAVALARFGCCSHHHAAALVRELAQNGRATTPAGHAVRIVAFGGATDAARVGGCTTISMRHVVAFLRTYLKAHWTVLRHAQIRDQGLAVLALLEKWGENADGAAPRQERDHGALRM